MLLRLRFKVLGALLVAVVLPALISTTFDPYWELGQSMANTTIATFVAMVVGAFILQRMSAYPGIRSLSFILYSFFVTYAVVVLVLLVTRANYSRVQLILSFAFVVAWFFAMSLAERSVRRPRLLAAALWRR